MSAGAQSFYEMRNSRGAIIQDRAATDLLVGYDNMQEQRAGKNQVKKRM